MTTGTWLRVASVAAGLGVAGSAHAQGVPGASTVVIQKVAKDDGFFRDRKSLVGLLCAVSDEGLHSQGSGAWVGGEMTCVDGQTYYFYRIQVEPADFGLDAAAIREAAGITVAPPVPGDGAWTRGERLRIVGVSPEDSYIEMVDSIVGRECTVKETELNRKPDGYYGGSLTCGSDEYYFYKVAVAELDAPAAPAAMPPATASAASAPAATPAAAAPAASPWGAGKMVKIVDFAPADALAASKAALVGHVCSVVEAPLVDTGEGYFAGRLFCDDGKSYQAFKVKVEAAP